MSKTTRKRQPSLTREEMLLMRQNEEMCPFGRQTLVGAVRCKNCIFNHLEDECCYGTKEMARIHMRRLGLEY